jgi:hypothetical protein
MRRRPAILAGMAAGLLWSVAVLWTGIAVVNLPVFSLLPTLAFAFLVPGLVLMVMIARLAARRFFDDAAIDGGSFPPGSGGEIDIRVMRNTVEQLVLALTLWPPVAYLLLGDGPGVAAALGLGFAVARLAFWAGYHLSPPLRAFGFAATFYPTVLAVVWAGGVWVAKSV